MKLLVIGAGMMGSAAAYDMARSSEVESVTLADTDAKRAKEAAARINKLTKSKKVRPVQVDASKESAARKLIRGHAAALSAVPYFYNLALCKAAVEAGCHFADLGGNNTVVRQELKLDKAARKKNVCIAPDCGLSPGMASILGGELVKRLGGKADAVEIYVGGLPYSFGDQELENLFAAHGAVTSAQVISDRYTGQSKGFGFVEMSEADGTAAINTLNGTNVGGRSITVNEAKPREDRNSGGGGGYGGGGGGGRNRW
jgi:hypothetical protein